MLQVIKTQTDTQEGHTRQRTHTHTVQKSNQAQSERTHIGIWSIDSIQI